MWVFGKLSHRFFLFVTVIHLSLAYNITLGLSFICRRFLSPVEVVFVGISSGIQNLIAVFWVDLIPNVHVHPVVEH